MINVRFTDEALDTAISKLDKVRDAAPNANQLYGLMLELRLLRRVASIAQDCDLVKIEPLIREWKSQQ